MEKDLAIMILMSCTRGSLEISNLIPIIKENCDNKIYEEFSLKISRIVYDIRENIVNRIFLIYPDLEGDMENRMSKYDRSYY